VALARPGPDPSNSLSLSLSLSPSLRRYDRLFKAESPGKETGEFLDDLNPDSVVLTAGRLEASAALACVSHLGSDAKYPSDLRFQFERMGYYVMDDDAMPEKLVFNRVVTLRDTWGKPKEGAKPAAERRRGAGGGGTAQQSAAEKEDAQRVKIVAGTVLEASAHPNSDALKILSVNLGDAEPRTIVAKLGEGCVRREVASSCAPCC
jgi:glutaminyl-tRNA synthetase